MHKQPLASIKLPGMELNVGTAQPDTVELHEVPNVKYRYVVVDNQTVVVDPGTRKIVKIIHCDHSVIDSITPAALRSDGFLPAAVGR